MSDNKHHNTEAKSSDFPTSGLSDFSYTPKKQGFSFPAEWFKHEATWLSWPHKEASWPGKMHKIYNPYSEFVLRIAQHQKVCINVSNEDMKESAR